MSKKYKFNVPENVLNKSTKPMRKEVVRKGNVKKRGKRFIYY